MEINNTKERPIIFSGDSIRAILENRKTQTRRIIKTTADILSLPEILPATIEAFKKAWLETSPYQIGGILWVRETWQDYCPTWNGSWCGCGSQEMIQKTHKLVYRASDDSLVDGRKPLKWKSPIFMPRWASRITLEITNVRVERVQDISEEDAKAEGSSVYEWRGDPDQGENRGWVDIGDYQKAFRDIWDSIHGLGAWDRNDWVWAITFKRAAAICRLAEAGEKTKGGKT